MRIVGVGVLATILLASSAFPVNAQVQSTYDTDIENWLITGDNDYHWQSSGGNPGGYMHVDDLATGQHNYAVAPAKFLGDWSNATASDTISVDIYLDNTSGGPIGASCPYWTFEISGPGGRAVAIDGCVNLPSEHVWTNYKVSLDESDWIVELGSWSGILENVTSLRINAEFIHGDEWVGLDNVWLSSPVIWEFVPCVYSDFNSAGTGDWSFQNTDGVSNPGSGGNSGGYALFTDKDGLNSYAYAPSSYLGDWSSLSGSGCITVDLRVFSYDGTNEGSPEFIRLTGPGGSAHVSLGASDLPAGRRLWKSFVFPLDPSVWTVDSGTWTSLLSLVTECRVDMEFFGGTESVGFDNFGRLADTCAAIDVPVQTHGPNVGYCGYHSLLGVAGTGLNPFDDELYGVVRYSSASGGGLYTVTGTDPGRMLQSYNEPGHVILDTDGDAFVSEPTSGNIYRLEWGGSSSLWVSGFHSGDDDPIGMAFAPPGFNGPNVSEGDILVVDAGYLGPDEIWAFSPDTPEGERVVLPDRAGPVFYDIASSQEGTVYVCDAVTPDSLFILHPDGTLSSFALSDSVGSIVSVVYDDVDSVIYIAEWDNERVLGVVASTGLVTLVADGFSSFNQACLEIDSQNRRLWVADGGYGRVYEFCLEDLTGVEDTSPPALVRECLAVSPNPFSGFAVIRFAPPGSGPVGVQIYDVSGRLVRHLKSEWMSKRAGTVHWDGRDDAGRRVSSGIYLVRVEADGLTQTGRVVLLR